MDTQPVRKSAGRNGVVAHDGPYEAVVQSWESLTPTTLYCQAKATTPLNYQPGQYCMVAIEHTARAFSFVTPPAGHHLEFLIDTRPGGPASLFWQQAQPGTRLKLTAPYGHFLLDLNQTQPLLFIAGGTGLAPLMAHLLSLIAQKSTRPVTLIVGHRFRHEVFWQQKLTTLAQQHNFMYQCVIGSLTPALSSLGDISAHHIYICGSANMCTNTAETLYARGASPMQVNYELFT